jgi:ssDNA-binding Zn-finger/Zn-ribbon topoisomerase 1
MLKLGIETLKTLIQGAELDRRRQNLRGICPKCGGNEFGMSLERGHRFGCYRLKKCGFTGNIYTLLSFLGKLNEFKQEEDFVEIKEERVVKKKIGITIEPTQDIECKLPLGYKRIFSDSYLESRRWVEGDFYSYEVGRSKIDPDVGRDYVIFPIRIQGIVVGWVARHSVVLSKEERKLLEQQGQQLPLRYRNSNSDFSKLLYGIEEVTHNTHTIILCEGIFDKKNIDTELLLGNSEHIKCVCTFKCDISNEQLEQLTSRPSIQTIYLFYDSDVLNKIRVVSSLLEGLFTNVLVTLSTTGHDPGEMLIDEMSRCIEDSVSVYDFLSKNLQKKVLE